MLPTAEAARPPASQSSAGKHAKIADLGEVGYPRRPALRSMSKSPVGGGARVGSIGAIGTRADGAAEMLAELGMVLGDPGTWTLLQRNSRPVRWKLWV